MLDRQAHWLKVQESLRYPRWLVTFDSEARVEYENTRQHHRLRCAVACFDRIDSETGEVEKTEWFETTDAAALWRWITERTKADRRTVVFAHNLGYDLMVTGALEQLPALGWQARHFSLDSYRCWARYVHGRRGLSLVDTWSFYPASLERIAGMLNMRKLALPTQDAPEELWLARCRRDVEITRAMVHQLLGYLEHHQLGSFKLTGPAQASAAFRHHFLKPAHLLVHDHSAAIDAEREAASTGRVEAWRHGRQQGWTYEWDYRMAYAHLARRAQLPIKLLGFRNDLERADVVRFREHYELLCEVDVETAVPVVPARGENGILWPVGRFSTTCWDLELQLLESEGGDYRVRKAWIYKRAPALKEWAEWIIDRLDGPKPESSQLQQLMLKAWSRSLIGRFGLRYPMLEQIGTADTYEISIVPQLYGDSDELRSEIQIGREVFVQHGATEGKDSTPALMSYVMAMGRVELWLAMRLAGLENVAYIDTDSLLVNAAGHSRLLQLADASPSYNLRYVKRHSKVDVLGPRRLLLNGRPKIAGLPSSAVRVGADSWKVEMWESPRGAITRGRAAELVVSVHTFTLRSPDHRRRHVRAGSTAPYRLETW